MTNAKRYRALSLAKECYSMKLDLLTNATVVDDASNEDKEESNEPDYDEDKDQKSKKRKQEKRA
jgi:hypothetical protein